MIGFRVTVRWPATAELGDVRLQLAADDPASAQRLLVLMAEAVKPEGALVVASIHPDPAEVWGWADRAPT